MVHGFGRLDLPADRGIPPGAQIGSEQTAIFALPPCGLGGVQTALPLSRDGLPHRRSANACRSGVPRHETGQMSLSPTLGRGCVVVRNGEDTAPDVVDAAEAA